MKGSEVGKLQSFPEYQGGLDATIGQEELAAKLGQGVPVRAMYCLLFAICSWSPLIVRRVGQPLSAPLLRQYPFREVQALLSLG